MVDAAGSPGLAHPLEHPPPASPSVHAPAAFRVHVLDRDRLAAPLPVVASIGPTASSTVTFLAPAFGIAWGALVLGEQLGPTLFVGAALILASVAMVAGLWPPAILPRFVDRVWTNPPLRPAKLQTRG